MKSINLVLCRWSWKQWAPLFFFVAVFFDLIWVKTHSYRCKRIALKALGCFPTWYWVSLPSLCSISFRGPKYDGIAFKLGDKSMQLWKCMNKNNIAVSMAKGILYGYEKGACSVVHLFGRDIRKNGRHKRWAKSSRNRRSFCNRVERDSCRAQTENVPAERHHFCNKWACENYILWHFPTRITVI